MLSSVRAGLRYVDVAWTSEDVKSARRSLELARTMRDLVHSQLESMRPAIEQTDYARVVRGLDSLSTRIDEFER